VRCDT